MNKYFTLQQPYFELLLRAFDIKESLLFPHGYNFKGHISDKRDYLLPIYGKKSLILHTE